MNLELVAVPICEALRNTAASIPPVLHQSWYNRTLPTAVAPLVARWRAVLPNWRHRVWSDDDNRRLWQENFPELLDLYDGYDVPIKRADAARLVYMSLTWT
jgi:mannosyltransferase OCH1-like enzyme